MTVPESCWLDVEGGTVHYLAAGEKGGRAIVLLHGASFTSQTWLEIGTIETLCCAGYLVYALDMPGFGSSSRSTCADRTWLKLVVDLLEIEIPVLLSPSMSGTYSLPLATGDPGRISGYIAVAPVAILNHAHLLSRITAPVLAIWGEHDTLIPISQADLLVRSVKNGRKVIIPGGSHAPYMSDPAAFHRVVLDFLAELPGRTQGSADAQ
jgi:pimeloyl-ACP methyl ester carboxylesterase